MRGLVRPGAVGVLILFLLVIASGSIWRFAGPALSYGLTVELRTAPDRQGPISVERAIATDVLTKVLQQTAGAQWVIWRGSFEVPPAGVKGFRLTAKGGAQLFVDGLLALQATGGDAVARQVALDGGSHELALIYQHLEGAPAIELEWIDAQQRREFIPPASLAPQSMPRAAWYLRKHPHAIGITMAIAWIAVAAYLFGLFLGPSLLRFLELDGFFSDRPARLVLAFSVLLAAYPIWWGLSVSGYWAMDEISAGTVRYGMSVGYASGWYDKYPPFHYYVINLFLLPFFAADRLGLVSILDTTAYAVESGVVRALSLAMGIGSVALVYVCGAITFGKRQGVLAALVWTMALPFVYHGKLGTLDVPYTFWFALSLLFYIRIVQRGARRDYVLFATAAVLAVCTKDQAYGMYALPALHILIVTVRQHLGTPSPAAVLRAIFDRRLLVAVVWGVALFAIVHNLAFNLDGFRKHVEIITGVASEDYRVYDSGPVGQWRLFLDVAAQTAFCMSWPGALASIAGILLARGSDQRGYRWLALPALSYYVTFLAVVGYCYDRFLLPVCLVLSLFAGHSIARALEWRRERWHATAAVGLVFAYMCLRAASINLLMAADGREAAARWIRENVASEHSVAITGPQEYNPPVSGRMVRLIPTLHEMDESHPDYLIVNSGYRRRFVLGSLEGPFFAALESGKLPYRLVHRIKQPVGLAILTWEGPFRETAHVAHTSVNKLNPEILIYRRETTSP